MRRALRASLCAAVLLLAAASGVRAQSQATTGVIQGTVTSEGNAVAGASVVLTNTATNFEKSLVTDGAGRFRGVLLPLGPYRIVVAADGFANLTREGVALGVGQIVDLGKVLGHVVELPHVLVERLGHVGPVVDDERRGVECHRLPSVVVQRPRAEHLVVLR